MTTDFSRITSSEVAAILKVNQNTFTAWLNSGWFRPSVQGASKRGVRNLFNRFDLCRIQLFRYLISTGFEKMDAAIQSQIAFENVGKEPQKFKYMFLSGTFNEVTLITTWGGKIVKVIESDDIQKKIAENFSVFVINLVPFVEQVDRLVEAYKKSENYDE